jgi:hypothetical protein
MGTRAARRAVVVATVSALGVAGAVTAGPATATPPPCAEGVSDTYAPPDTDHYIAVADVAAVADSPDELYSAGYRGSNTANDAVGVVRHRVGGTWTETSLPLIGPTQDFASAVAAPAANDVWVVDQGDDEPNLTTVAGAWHWDGFNWTGQLLPVPSGATAEVLLDVAASAPGDVWAVGRYSDSQGHFHGLVYHYTGGSWGIVDTSAVDTTGARIRSVAPITADDVWAVGQDSAGTVTLHWDGQDWTSYPTADATMFDMQMSTVVARATDDVWELGYGVVQGKGVTFARHWNGAGWSSVPMPQLGPSMFLPKAVGTTAGELWATVITDDASVGQPALLRYDGTRWTVMTHGDGLGVQGVFPEAFAIASDGLYLVGSTNDAGYVFQAACASTTSGPADDNGELDTSGTEAATQTEPVRTAITFPAGSVATAGTATVRQTNTTPLSVATELPPAVSAADPFLARFTLDSSHYPAAPSRLSTLVLHEGQPVPACTDATTATPDPCIDSEGPAANDVEDRTVVVRTTVGGRWTLAQTPPAVTVTPPAGVGSPVRLTFEDNVTGVTAAGVVLRDAGVDVPTTFVCRDASNAVTACTGATIRTLDVQPVNLLTPGAHYTVDFNEVGARPITDVTGVPLLTQSQQFRAATVQQDTGSAITYTWKRASAKAAYGGSYRASHAAGTTASYSFRGGKITLLSVKRPDGGKALVTVDGVEQCTCDYYAAKTTYHAARTFTGLGSGQHTLTIRATGTKRAASRGTFVTLDAVQVGTASVVKTPAAAYRWQRLNRSQASDGKVAAFDLSGATAGLTFEGTSAHVALLRGPDAGKATVRLGGTVKTVDLYAPSRSIMLVRFDGLTDAQHTVSVIVTGLKRAASSGRLVALDRIIIG